MDANLQKGSDLFEQETKDKEVAREQAKPARKKIEGFYGAWFKPTPEQFQVDRRETSPKKKKRSFARKGRGAQPKKQRREYNRPTGNLPRVDMADWDNPRIIKEGEPRFGRTSVQGAIKHWKNIAEKRKYNVTTDSIKEKVVQFYSTNGYASEIQKFLAKK